MSNPSEEDDATPWVNPPGLRAILWHDGTPIRRILDAPIPCTLAWRVDPGAIITVAIVRDPWNGQDRDSLWDAVLGEPRWFFDRGPRNQPFKVYYAFNPTASTVHVTVNTSWIMTMHVDKRFKVWTIVGVPGQAAGNSLQCCSALGILLNFLEHGRLPEGW
jgi:hypothetical protein